MTRDEQRNQVITDFLNRKKGTSRVFYLKRKHPVAIDEIEKWKLDDCELMIKYKKSPEGSWISWAYDSPEEAQDDLEYMLEYLYK